MNKLKDICTITYTNSNCHDILKVHLGQMTKFAPNVKSYVFSNEKPDFELNDHIVCLYDNNQSYYKQWVSCLESVKENYIIYLQEDFFLYDNIIYDELEKCKNFLKKNGYSFIRFLKFELSKAIHDPYCNKKEFPDISLEEKIYDAYSLDPDCFAFMMQTTMWRKNDFISLYNHVKSKKWFESAEWDKGIRDLGLKGAYYHDETSKKVGKFHWESKIWPHICTAVGKGKWSITHHDHKLTDILKEYNININIRGVR